MNLTDYIKMERNVSKHNEIVGKVLALRGKSSKYYQADSSSLKLDKVFNSGMGRLDFVSVLPDENTVLVNSCVANKRDLRNIESVFSGFKVEQIALGYPDYYRETLISYRKKLQRKAQ